MPRRFSSAPLVLLVLATLLLAIAGAAYWSLKKQVPPKYCTTCGGVVDAVTIGGNGSRSWKFCECSRMNKDYHPVLNRMNVSDIDDPNWECEDCHRTWTYHYFQCPLWKGSRFKARIQGWIE